MQWIELCRNKAKRFLSINSERQEHSNYRFQTFYGETAANGREVRASLQWFCNSEIDFSEAPHLQTVNIQSENYKWKDIRVKTCISILRVLLDRKESLLRDVHRTFGKANKALKCSVSNFSVQILLDLINNVGLRIEFRDMKRILKSDVL